MIWTYTAVDELEQAHWVSPRPALRPHLHSTIQITFVLEGELGFHTPGGDIVCSQGDVLIIPPMTLHQAFSAASMHGKGHNIYVRSPVQRCLPAGRKQIRRLHGAASMPWPDVIAAAQNGMAVASADDSVWNSLALDIWTMPAPVSTAASRLGLTREGFARAFDRVFGISPKSFSLALRLDRARHLLVQNYSTVDAAAALAFADQSHFGRLFKAAYGTTPGRYKETMVVGSNRQQ